MTPTSSALALVSSLLLTASVHAGAQTPAGTPAAQGGCVQLKTVAEVEREVLDEQGKPVKRLVPATKVVPGSEVVWTVTANNVCDKPAEKILIDNPVPQHMSYVANSATGPGTEISFSLDGKSYGAPGALTVREADGTMRPARPDEYTHIRWSLRNALGPGAVAFARFRATVK